MLLVPLLFVAFAQDPAPALAERVNQAIDRGVQALLDAQLIDGSWEFVHAESPCGATAMALYTLVRSGVPARHPAVELGYAWLAAHEPSDKLCYNLSWMSMAWGERPGPEAERRIVALLERLLDCQDGTGLFTYGDTPVADLSNTQYAALALRAASARGGKVPAKVWQELARGVRACQVGGSREAEEAGFAYFPHQGGAPPEGPPPGGGPPPPGPSHGATGSMTAAAIATLTLAEQALGRRLGAQPRRELERAREQGVAWLAARFEVERNPGADDGPGAQQWLPHYLYGLERCGAFLALERIGDHDWYDEGARYLVAAQTAEGRWEHGPGEEVATCLALLFLKRASFAVTGEVPAPLPRWRSGEVGELSEERRGYAGDSARNLLAGAELEAGASSRQAPELDAAAAVDGTFCRGWQARSDDTAPWWKLRLKQAASAETLLFTRLHNRARDRASSRPVALRLLIDGEVVAERLELDPDPQRKTRFVLPRRQRVREIEIHFLDAAGPAVGIAEVELQ